MHLDGNFGVATVHIHLRTSQSGQHTVRGAQGAPQFDAENHSRDEQQRQRQDQQRQKQQPQQEQRQPELQPETPAGGFEMRPGGERWQDLGFHFPSNWRMASAALISPRASRSSTSLREGAGSISTNSSCAAMRFSRALTVG